MSILGEQHTTPSFKQEKSKDMPTAATMKRERKQTKVFVPEPIPSDESRDDEPSGISLNSENDETHSSELEERARAEEDEEDDGVVVSDNEDEENYRRLVTRDSGRQTMYDSEEEYSLGSATTSDDSTGSFSGDNRSRSPSPQPRRREKEAYYPRYNDGGDYYRPQYYEDRRYQRSPEPYRRYSREEEARRYSEKKRSSSSSGRKPERRSISPPRYRPAEIAKLPQKPKQSSGSFRYNPSTAAAAADDSDDNSRRAAKEFAKALGKYTPEIEIGEHKMKSVMRSMIDKDGKTFRSLAEQLKIIKNEPVGQIAKPVAKTLFGSLYTWSRSAETGDVVAERAIRSKLEFLTMPSFCANQKKLTELFNKHAPAETQEAMKKRKDKQISRVDWLHSNGHVDLTDTIAEDMCGEVVFKDKNGKLVSVIQAAAIRANNFIAITASAKCVIPAKDATRIICAAMQITRLVESYCTSKLDRKKETPKRSRSRSAKPRKPQVSNAVKRSPAKSPAKTTVAVEEEGEEEEEEEEDDNAQVTKEEEPPKPKSRARSPVHSAEEEEEEAPPVKRIKKNDGTPEKKKPAPPTKTKVVLKSPAKPLPVAVASSSGEEEEEEQQEEVNGADSQDLGIMEEDKKEIVEKKQVPVPVPKALPKAIPKAVEKPATPTPVPTATAAATPTPKIAPSNGGGLSLKERLAKITSKKTDDDDEFFEVARKRMQQSKAVAK